MTKQIEKIFRNAAFATVRSFVAKFTDFRVAQFTKNEKQGFIWYKEK